jgi:hypothetical protein
LRTVDASGVDIATGGAQVVVNLVGGARQFATDVVDNGDGSYGVQFVASAVGKFTPRVVVDGIPLAPPMRVLVRAARGEGIFEAKNALAFGAPLRHAVVQGAVAELSVLARDVAGMPLERGSTVERFVAHFVPRSARAGAAFDQPLLANDDGTYTVRFQLHAAVDHVVTIEHVASGVVVAHTPALIRVTPIDDAASSRVDASKAIVEGDGLSHAVTGRDARFRIVRDALYQIYIHFF